jgi:hypothetical protein
MNPWHLLWYGFGWFFVGICVLGMLGFAIGKVVAPMLAAFKTWRRYRKTRHIEPVADSIWDQGGSTLRITRIAENGRICMTTGTASWSDSPEEWKRRVRNRRLFLVRGPKE